MGPINFLYNSKFDFTAKSLVTNTVVIARVLKIAVFRLIKLHIHLNKAINCNFSQSCRLDEILILVLTEFTE